MEDAYRPTYSDRDLCKHAADFIQSNPAVGWDEAKRRAEKNLQACGLVPGPDVTPDTKGPEE